MKLCVIGGAGARSAFLTKSLVKSAREIRVDHIVLLDNNEEHLRTYGQISKELARRMEPSLTFDITSWGGLYHYHHPGWRRRGPAF